MKTIILQIIILLTLISCKTIKETYDEYDFKFHLQTLPDNRFSNIT